MSIEIVSNSRADELLVNCGHVVKLKYPIDWEADAERAKSLWYSSAERELLQWIGERRFIEGFGSQECETSGTIVKALSAANVGSMCAPHASFFTVMAMSKFMTLMALWDDEVIEIGALESVEPVRTALHNAGTEKEGRKQDDKWADHFSEFGAYIVAHSGASGEYMKRLGDGICQWALNSQSEQVICAKLGQKGAACDLPLSHFVKQRAGTIGMDIFARLVEIGSGFEFPVEITAHEHYTRILDAVNLAIACINDLASAGKDCVHQEMDYRWSNLLWAHYLINKPSCVQDSVEWVVGLHNSAVEELDLLSSSLATWISKPLWVAKMAAYCHCLRQLIVGMAHWHGTAPRYQTLKVHDVPNARVFVMSLVK